MRGGVRSVLWRDPAMTSDGHIQLIHRYCAAFAQGNVGALEELIHPEVVDHSAYEGQPVGIEGYRHFFRLWKRAIPDLKLELELTLSEGDLIAYRWHATGTHLGPYLDHPPSGNAVRFSAISINRVRDGLIVEEWVEIDQLGLLQQIDPSSPSG
jgi:steroid delta-isomerase-like uncharacterized protein